MSVERSESIDLFERLRFDGFHASFVFAKAALLLQQLQEYL